MSTTPPTSASDVRRDYLLPYRGGTLSVYEFYLDTFLTWAGEQGIDPLGASRSGIEKYVHHLYIERGLLASTVNTALCPVRGFYRFAHDEEIIDRDPAARARRPRVPRGVNDTLGLDRQQMRAFLNAGREMGDRYYGAAYLLACMALRASEACSLQVDSHRRTQRGHRVLEFTGKGGVPARMPLPVPVVRALDASAGGRREGALLLTRDGSRPLSRQGLATIVNTLGRRAGLDFTLRPHRLRHSCITNALDSGASLRKVQDLARHSDPRTTMQYDRNRTNLDDHAVHSLVAFLALPDERGDPTSLSHEGDVEELVGRDWARASRPS